MGLFNLGKKKEEKLQFNVNGMPSSTNADVSETNEAESAPKHRFGFSPKTPKQPKQLKQKVKKSSKKPTGPQRKRKSLFFNRIKIITLIFFGLFFFVAMFGYLSLKTVDASLSHNADINLPPQVQEISTEYNGIKDKYVQFNFDVFKKVFNEQQEPQTVSDDKMWEKSSLVMFGAEYLKQMKANLASIAAVSGDTNVKSSDIEKFTPKINITGVTVHGKNMVVTLHWDTQAQTWLFTQTSPGKWTTNNLPEGYRLGKVELNPVNSAPYFELSLSDPNAPKMTWRVIMSPTAVIEGGQMRAQNYDKNRSGEANVTSDVSKMQAAGSYIMVKNGKSVKYISVVGQNNQSGQLSNAQMGDLLSALLSSQKNANTTGNAGNGQKVMTTMPNGGAVADPNFMNQSSNQNNNQGQVAK